MTDDICHLWHIHVYIVFTMNFFDIRVLSFAKHRYKVKVADL